MRAATQLAAALCVTASPAAWAAQSVDDLFDDLMEDAVIADEPPAEGGDDLFDEGLDAMLGDESFDGVEIGATADRSPLNQLRSWKGFFEIKPRIFTQDLSLIHISEPTRPY